MHSEAVFKATIHATPSLGALLYSLPCHWSGACSYVELRTSCNELGFHPLYKTQFVSLCHDLGLDIRQSGTKMYWKPTTIQVHLLTEWALTEWKKRAFA